MMELRVIKRKEKQIELTGQLKISAYAITDTGKSRSRNEDRFCLVPELDFAQGPVVLEITAGQGLLLAIADGMGGAKAGDLAAEIAVQAVRDSSSSLNDSRLAAKAIRKTLEDIIRIAHQRIASVAKEGTAGMGTTLALAYLRGTEVHVAWCGDSRAYRYSAGPLPRETKYDLPHLKVLTRDHSVVWELVEKGKLDPHSAREHELSNVITQSLGDAGNPPAPESATYPVVAGDKILVCSDGLNNMLPDEFIQEFLAHDEGVDQIGQSLVLAANEAGGEDNISIILVSILSTPEVSPGKGGRPERPEAITAKSSLPKPDRNEPDAKRGNVLSERLMIGIILLTSVLLYFFWQSKVNSTPPDKPALRAPGAPSFHLPDSLVLDTANVLRDTQGHGPNLD